MTTPAQAAQDLYNQLLPNASRAFTDYIMQRTPWHLQTLMAGLVGNNVTIANAQSVVVKNAAGTAVAGSPGAAEIAGGVLADVKLTV